LLEQKLAPLLGGDAQLTVSEDHDLAAAERSAQVFDLGARYRVEVEGLRREFADAKRDCVERARVSAVLIALNLQKTPARGRISAAPEEAVPYEHAPLRLGVQLFAVLGYASEIGRGAPGAGVGTWLSWRQLRVGFSAAVLSATSIDLASAGGVRGSVGVTRVPLFASVSYVFALGRLELGPLLGLGGDLLRMRGIDVTRPQTELRINPGVLVAADAHVRWTREFALFLQIGLAGFPRAYALNVDPTGELGHTPRLWLNAVGGVEWRD
jgi:hypothetical protein